MTHTELKKNDNQIGQAIPEGPRALITYICTTCANPSNAFELYYESEHLHSKRCSHCKKITPHTRELPDDDEVQHYKRPSF